MHTFTKPATASVATLLVQAEAFASMTGFHYPETTYHRADQSGTFPLEAPVRVHPDNPDSKQGLFIWHNATYTPLVGLTETGTQVTLTLLNRDHLPYPIIQITMAWLHALAYYLEHDRDKTPERVIEGRAKQEYLSRFTPDL